MSKESFWLFGIDYLAQCSSEEATAIEIFLTKIIIHNEKQAMKILHVARSRGYVEVGESTRNFRISHKQPDIIAILQKRNCAASRR